MPRLRKPVGSLHMDGTRTPDTDRTPDMADPGTAPDGFPTNPHTAAMFEAQEGWGQVVTVLQGMVEQTRQAGFTDVQAYAIVAASFAEKTAVSAFVGAPREGEA